MVEETSAAVDESFCRVENLFSEVENFSPEVENLLCRVDAGIFYRAEQKIYVEIGGIYHRDADLYRFLWSSRGI